MDLETVIEAFGSALNVDKLAVQRLTPKIFMCGGPVVTDKSETENYLSFRDYVYRNLQDSNPTLFLQIVLAEKINQWFGEHHYSDLLALETDLAGLVSAIPIFIESPGSIAELGSFTATPEIRRKLLAFTEEQYADVESFIWLGPLQQIEKHHPDKVKVYQFNRTGNDNTFKPEDLEEVGLGAIADIKKWCVPDGREIKFNKELPAHRVLLLCDFVYVLGLAQIKEIQIFFDALGIQAENKDVKKYVWVAEKNGNVEKIHYGGAYYHVPLDGVVEYVSFSYKETLDKGMKNRDYWSAELQDNWKKDDDRRKSAFKKID